MTSIKRVFVGWRAVIVTTKSRMCVVAESQFIARNNGIDLIKPMVCQQPCSNIRYTLNLSVEFFGV